MTLIALPLPPSTNSIWKMPGKGSRPYLSKRYAAWKKECDGLYLVNKAHWKRVPGSIDITMIFDQTRRKRSDLDNRFKALLDWLQRVDLIENDSLVDRIEAMWGYAPEGCRVFVLPAG